MTTSPHKSVETDKDDEGYSSSTVVALFLLGIVLGAASVATSKTPCPPSQLVKKYELGSLEYRVRSLEEGLAMKAAYEAGRDGKENPYGKAP